LELPCHECTLDGNSRSVSTARRFFRDTTAHSELTAECVDLGQLALSELVTNAVIHGAPPIVVQVQMLEDTIRVDVEDHGRRPVRVGDLDADRVGGRGLAIVAAVAGTWGADHGSDARGAHVWFTLPVG
jgi:anti-sigma regulatory factor (Ser/Thr protein kinase)